MNTALVSIITPCYNGERYLDRYFASILHQTYPNLELIFINDGSTDRTEEIAQGYRLPLEQRGIRYTYLSQENAGQAAALNRGLKLFRQVYKKGYASKRYPKETKRFLTTFGHHPEWIVWYWRIGGKLNHILKRNR